MSFLDLNGRSDWRAVIRVAVWLHCLFFAHILIAGFFWVISILLQAIPWAGWRAWWRRCLPLFTIFPLTMLWLGVSLLNSPSAGDPIVWRIDARRLVEFLPTLVSAPDARIGQIIGIVFLLAPFLSGARLKRNWMAYLPFVFYMAWMGFFPHYLVGSFYNFERFGIIGLPFYFLCFEGVQDVCESHRLALVRSGLVVMVIVVIGWHSFRATIFNEEVAGYKSVVEKLEPQKKILMLDFDLTSKASYAPLMLHMAGWYQAEYGGLAEFNFANFWISPLQYKKNSLIRASQDFEWYPQSLDWQRHQGDSFHYVLIHRRESGEAWLRASRYTQVLR